MDRRLARETTGDWQALCRKVGACSGAELLAGREGGRPTGVADWDEQLPDGGIPRHALTEWVEAGPSCGGGLLVHRVLELAREDNMLVALVDGSDSFCPGSAGESLCRRLFWVRCRRWEEALEAADLLAADGSFGFLLLDFRGLQLAGLRRVPGARWYFLQRTLRQGSTAGMVLTRAPIVPAAVSRVRLERPCRLADLYSC